LEKNIEVRSTGKEVEATFGASSHAGMLLTLWNKDTECPKTGSKKKKGAWEFLTGRGIKIGGENATRS